MKATANHPHYQPSKISCSCGVVYDTFSTRGDFGVDVCAACHPFYTGKQKLLDTAGRVERFRRKYANVGKGKGKEAPATAEATTAEAPAEPAAAE